MSNLLVPRRRLARYLIPILICFCGVKVLAQVVTPPTAAPASQPAAVMTTSASQPLMQAAPPPPPEVHSTGAERAQSAFGLCMFIVLAWLVGQLRRAPVRFPIRAIVWGLFFMFGFGILVVKDRAVLYTITQAVYGLLAFARKGSNIVFGDLANQEGAVVTSPSGVIIGEAHQVGFFAFFVLPTIIFLSCLIAVLYYIGIMQYVIQALAWLMSKSMGTSGAETLSAVANIFVGQTESPLIIKPLLDACTQSEIMVIMTAGFANIATGVLGLYSIWLGPYVQDAAGHLAACCFMSAPGALLVSKLIVPETEKPQTAAGVEFHIARTDTNLVDAASRGTTDGLHLALNVAAMLISFTALVAMVDACLGWASVAAHLMPASQPLTLELIFGWVFSPLAWLAGIPWHECRAVGSLLGVKTVLNELIAYSQMKDNLAAAAASGTTYLSPRSALVAMYALCGFANFASIGIQVGGISTMAPSRRHDLSRLGIWAMVGGAISTLMAACIVGIII